MISPTRLESYPTMDIAASRATQLRMAGFLVQATYMDDGVNVIISLKPGRLYSFDDLPSMDEEHALWEGVSRSALMTMVAKRTTQKKAHRRKR